MRILIDIAHPAHVHFFRHAIAEWRRHGHEVAVTAMEKDVTAELLRNFGIAYQTVNSPALPTALRPLRMLGRNWRLWRACRRFRPDVVTAVGGLWAAQTAWAMRRPAVVWDDTEHHTKGHRATWPFATVICSPDCYLLPPVRKQRLYAGSHELAYLHPRRFTPDAEVVRSLGIDPSQRYCIVRFVAWKAVHDVGQHGLVEDRKVAFVRSLAQVVRPYITSEGRLPAELEEYRLRMPAHLIHHAMAFAALTVGEGATMASESACLGVPAVYVNTLRAGTLNMFERFGLIRQTTDTDEALRLCLSWLADDRAAETCRQARQRMLAQKIDVTGYIVETVEDVGGKGR